MILSGNKHYLFSLYGWYLYIQHLAYKNKNNQDTKKQENMTYNLEAELQKYKLFTVWPFTAKVCQPLINICRRAMLRIFS